MSQYAETKTYKGLGGKEVSITTVYVCEDLIHMIYGAKIYTVERYGDLVSVFDSFNFQEFVFGSWDEGVRAVITECRVQKGGVLANRALRFG